MSSAAGRESDKFQLRLPDGMRDRIKAAAQANGRSMNAEIVATLQEAYPPGVSVGEIMSMMDEMARRLEEMSADERFEPVSRKLADTLERVRESPVFRQQMLEERAYQQELVEHLAAGRRVAPFALSSDGDPESHE